MLTSELIGTSGPITRLREKIERVASATSPVLIVGETGTGKELVAHAITDGHKAQAAKILGVDLSTLYRWQQKWRH